jgi:hypothetical protein
MGVREEISVLKIGIDGARKEGEDERLSLRPKAVYMYM